MDNEEQPSAPKCVPLHDVNDPFQKEISSMLKSFTYDIMGILALGKDGIMRSLTADRKVLSAEAFRPELVKAFLQRFPKQYRKLWEQDIGDVDGTMTPREKWFAPDDGILPAPLPQEKLDEARNDDEERKEKMREMLKNKDKRYIDAMGVLD
ncbi:hypothetical protein EK21DRAFT_112775 [Setomelanomma holmii]|uniref:Uncharacterized protein n=1 Tax=Setomelanomma holmii TaxID=210430 RepID=A0A9P4LLU3_9PLEO|nr:hypothetical protein EK21DRAFT_112775 [Setomelanomma holmii]